MQDEVFLYVYRYINIDIFCYNVLWVKKKEENIKGILYGLIYCINIRLYVFKK